MQNGAKHLLLASHLAPLYLLLPSPVLRSYQVVVNADPQGVKTAGADMSTYLLLSCLAPMGTDSFLTPSLSHQPLQSWADPPDTSVSL